jgi:hypothetical protein
VPLGGRVGVYGSNDRQGLKLDIFGGLFILLFWPRGSPWSRVELALGGVPL